MNVDFLNPVLSACENVMSSMAELHIHTGKPWIRKPHEPETGGTVTGLICMRGTGRVASVAVIFSEKTLKSMSHKILPDSQNKEFLAFDLVGEISNLVIGGAKSLLLRQGYSFQITLPTVISGHDYLIAHQTKAPIIRVPFDSEIGRFHVEASFEGPPLSEEEKKNKRNQEPVFDTSEVELF